MKQKTECLLMPVLLLFFSVFTPPEASAREPFKPAPEAVLPQGSAERGQYLTVKAVVAGPGDALYLWWGHCGLIIQDAATGSNDFYDWGQFSFQEGHFYRNFAMGLLIYACGKSPTDWQLRDFKENNRDVTIYTLNLPPAVKDGVRLFCENNVKPQNCEYLYHFFKDNCATRVRDIIDAAVGGQLKAAASRPGPFTVRQNIRRYMYFSPFFDWLLNFWMGRNIDTNQSFWQEMFLPMEVGKQIEAFYYKDAAGQKVKLVSNVEVYNRSVGRPPVLSAPPPAGLAELLCSIILSVLVFIFTFWRYKRPPAGNRALGILQSVLGLFLGGVGTVLFFMTIFTNHDYTWNNLNAFYVNPLLLAAVPLGLVLAFSKKRAQGAQRALNVLWAYVLLAGLVVQLLNLVPALRQVDQPTALLVLPLSLALIISAFCARIPQYGIHPKSRH